MCLSSSCGQRFSQHRLHQLDTKKQVNTSQPTSQQAEKKTQRLCVKGTGFCLVAQKLVPSKHFDWTGAIPLVPIHGNTAIVTPRFCGNNRRRQKWDDDKEVVVDSGTATACGVNSCHLKVAAQGPYTENIQPDNNATSTVSLFSFQYGLHCTHSQRILHFGKELI